jgi:hypothetical protein
VLALIAAGTRRHRARDRAVPERAHVQVAGQARPRDVPPTVLWPLAAVTVTESRCPKSRTPQRPSSTASTAAVRVTLDHTAILRPLFLLFSTVETRGIEPLTPALQSS